MSVEATNGEVVDFVSRLRDALIAMGRLTPEDVVRIDDVIRTTGLGFGDAAIELGLLMPEDLEEAAHAVHQLLPKASTDGIFEGALRRRLFKRNLPVKYVRKVKPGPSLILAHQPDSTYSEQIR